MPLPYAQGVMVPKSIQTLFHDIDVDTFIPEQYPNYCTSRVLEWGNDDAVGWMRSIFSEDVIRCLLMIVRRLSPKSATFWALIYGIVPLQEAALEN